MRKIMKITIYKSITYEMKFWKIIKIFIKKLTKMHKTAEKHVKIHGKFLYNEKFYATHVKNLWNFVENRVKSRKKMR